jgi:hypothetical protein
MSFGVAEFGRLLSEQWAVSLSRIVFYVDKSFKTKPPIEPGNLCSAIGRNSEFIEDVTIVDG